MSICAGISCESNHYCVHGFNPAAHQCLYCEMQAKIDSLESQVKALTEMYKDLSCKVAGFSDHRIRQIDENRKISKRVDEIQNDHAKIINGCVDKIDALEKWKKELLVDYSDIREIHRILNEHYKSIFHGDPQGLKQRIDDVIELFTKGDLKLESEIDALATEINTVRALGSRSFHPKKPHKCPVCDGSGNHPDQSPRLGCKVFIETGIYVCISCEGKGIIWG